MSKYGNSKELYYQGQYFPSRKALYKYLTKDLDDRKVITYSAFCTRLKHEKNIPLMDLITDRKTQYKSKPVSYQGKEYTSLKHFHLAIQRKNPKFISYSQMRRLHQEENVPLEEIVERYKHRLNLGEHFKK